MEQLGSQWTDFDKTLYFCFFVGYAVAQLVQALRYKPEGRGFDSSRSQLEFSVT
jgi:hypothetical protein